MQDYAVVKIAHRQYIVEPDKTYEVDKFEANPGDKIALEVLAVAKGDKLTVGTPTVDKAKVEVEVLDQGKGEKVSTKVYKAKSNYRRRYGLRKRVTTFKVLNIK